MKKMSFLLLAFLVLLGVQPVFAADATEAAAAVVADAATTAEPVAEKVADTVTSAPIEAAAEVVAEAPTEVPAPAAETPAQKPAVEAPAAENLEFVSGEVTALDEAGNKLTIKLYGETGDGAADKSITVSVDPNTDITDGEKDRELKSLAAGTEVDVEYDPASNKATYIFVY